MKHTGLKEYSIEDILKHYNLIVPEIQREYVWGFNTHNIIQTFLDDIKEARHNKQVTTTSSSKAELLKVLDNPALDDFTKSKLEAILNDLQDITDDVSEMNIGFLYSYRPSYSDGSKDNDLYLIDGQQRFTTLFLLLFYFAIKEGELDYFNELFKVHTSKSSLGFDYRVRSLTHQFFIELLKNICSLEGLMSIRQQTWFLKNYSQDVTVNSICGNDNRKSVFEIFHDCFEQDDKIYFDYIKSKIKFWHFKTEETSQGEELYITMNSRGQQLADNENIRAKLFDSNEVKVDPLRWSEKWEQWQDFFWKKRDKTKGFSADEGFNEFLRWCQLLQMIDLNSSKEDKDLEENIKSLQRVSAGLDAHYLNLSDIELNFKTLEFINNFFQTDIKGVLDYYPDYRGSFNFDFSLYISGTTLSQSQLFLLLPLIKYCKIRIQKNLIKPLSFMRVYQFIKNLLDDNTITKSIRDQVINIVEHISLLEVDEEINSLLVKENTSKTILNEEQERKLNFYNLFENNRVIIENWFWYTESLRYVKGSILHFINHLWGNDYPKSISEFSKFEKFVQSLDYYLVNENELRGELIPTDVYYKNNDKVICSNYHIKKDGLLHLITELMNMNNPSLKDFKIKRHKDWFTKMYSDFLLMEQEDNIKNQLYLIYIIKENQFFNLAKWSWGDNRFSFGVYPNINETYTIFFTGSIFQMIKSKFVENHSHILDFHRTKFDSLVVYDELNTWSKN